MYTFAQYKEVLVTTGRMLIFLSVRPDMRNLGPLYIGAALLFSWLAGLGRYWDHPSAHWWQYLGLGSVAYIFVLAAVLWLVVWPLRPQNWRYENILVFLGLTAPLAFLYAIPVERFLSLRDAQLVNAWFLAIVALWRVALLMKFLGSSTQLPGECVFIGAVVPIAGIVVALTLLNLEHAVFEIMAGINTPPPTSNDTAYFVTLVLGALSFYGAIPLLLIYIVIIGFRQYGAWKARQGAESPVDPH